VDLQGEIPGQNLIPVKGLILRGSRNLFNVRLSENGREIEGRIKGKVLKSVEGYYNPLAPGDIVQIENGLITGLEKRRNEFARFNQKGQSTQLLAANVDLVICVCSVLSPPFRARFLDRALLQADAAEIPAIIVCNKYDLVSGDADPDTEERLSDFERLGYPVFRLSVLSGEGMDEFKRFISEKFSVLIGQSGVGKSSLVKALVPVLEIKIGSLNEKFDRGNHTTTQGVLFEIPDAKTETSTRIVDTPGIRRFAPARIPPEDLILHLREFAPLAGKCSYGLSWSHETEPGCKIMEAVHAGVIHEDRYESFLRIRDELQNKIEFPDLD
jgi:ribosome biogenesis GTPase